MYEEPKTRMEKLRKGRAFIDFETTTDRKSKKSFNKFQKFRQGGLKKVNKIKVYVACLKLDDNGVKKFEGFDCATQALDYLAESGIEQSL